MSAFDQAARYTAKLDPTGFVRWLLPGLDTDLVFTRWLNTQTIPFPGEPDRRCDTVMELSRASGLGPPWLLVLEFQTQPDPDMPERLLEYLARLRRDLRHGPYGRDKYPVAAGLVNLTGPAQDSALDMILPGETGVEMRWRMGMGALSAVDAVGVVQAVRNGTATRALLPWVPLMRGGDQATTIAQWKEAAGLEPDRPLRSSYGGLALVFADLAGCLTPWDHALEDWTMEESQVVRRWQAAAREETLRDVLLRVLQKRFAGALPAESLAPIRSQADVAALERWLDLAAEPGTTLEQMRAALGA